MSVTLANLQDGIDKLTGDYRVLTTTGAGSTTILVASAADNYWPNNYIVDWWAEITGTSASAEVRQVLSGPSGGTIAVRTAFSTTPGTGNTVKIKRYPPQERDYAIADACREIYPDLFTLKVDDSLVTGNVLLNSNFEDWPSTYSGAGTVAATSWVCGGAATATRVTGRFGSYAMRLTSAVAADDYIYQSDTENPALLDLAGKQLSMYGWFKGQTTTSGGTVRVICVDDEGTSTTQNCTISPTGGTGEWVKWEFTNLVLPTTINSISIRLLAGIAGTSDWDNIYLCDTVYQQNVPASFTTAPRQLWVSGAGADWVQTTSWTGCHNYRIINDNGTLKIAYNHPFSALGYKLRLVGTEPLVAPTSSSGTINITTNEAQRLMHLAASLMFERIAVGGGNKNQAQIEKNRDWFRARAQSLKHYKMVPPVQFLEVK